MAADSLVTSDRVVSGTVRKLSRLKDGGIVGCAGRVDVAGEFAAWLNGVAEKPKEVDDDFYALVLTADGEVFLYDERLSPTHVEADFYAIGSGHEVAKGAMAAGATPEEAVEIACKLNLYTGPPVLVERLDSAEEGG